MKRPIDVGGRQGRDRGPTDFEQQVGRWLAVVLCAALLVMAQPEVAALLWGAR